MNNLTVAKKEFRTATLNQALTNNFVGFELAAAPIKFWARECWDHDGEKGRTMQRTWQKQLKLLGVVLQPGHSDKDRWE